MLKIKQFQNLEQVKNATKLLKNDWYYFLWEFLREVDSKNDELIIILVLDWNNIILTCTHSNQEKLPKFLIFIMLHNYLKMKYMISTENQLFEQTIIF